VHWLTERRRRHLLEHPFPDAWRAILERDVGAYRLLDADEQQRLRDLVQVFVAEKHWEGAGGLEITDEIRVTVAGTGCQMLLNRDHDLFADVISIVVYPSAVVVPERARSFWDPGLAVAKGDTPVIGLAGRRDALVLAWDAALRGARDQRDGSNVVIHELAHKIDFLDGSADGTPPSPTAPRAVHGRARSSRRSWRNARAPSAANAACSATTRSRTRLNTSRSRPRCSSKSRARSPTTCPTSTRSYATFSGSISLTDRAECRSP
jgi:Mlc titration factor MtfA (ptsG expression regulator)